jgi:hypothetical protein
MTERVAHYILHLFAPKQSLLPKMLAPVSDNNISGVDSLLFLPVGQKMLSFELRSLEVLKIVLETGTTCFERP